MELVAADWRRVISPNLRSGNETDNKWVFILAARSVFLDTFEIFVPALDGSTIPSYIIY